MPKLNINTTDLYYEMTGEGEPVLFIHGLGSSTRDWAEQVPFFSKNFKVVTCDLRGHGQSHKPPGPYSMSLFASDMAGLIKSLGFDSIHVVGISLGGMVAFQLVVDHPELIKSMVIVNSGPELIARTLKDRWQVFLRFAIVRLLGMRKMGEVLSKRLFPKEEQAGIRKIFIERWAENDQRAYVDTMRAIVGWSVSAHLGQINIPTLVVTADQDYTPVSAKEAYIPKLPQAELMVIQDSHHATPVDQPEAFNKVVCSFLLKHSKN
ncbi:MAG TPA: alpha/beta hydrolase [Anaerolineales bacterium]|nr:alpha/beta hydrolase [Anaerolineales bacterium]HNB35292.1 alpha/beta hydrolase [Anaerolineales bacterium]